MKKLMMFVLIVLCAGALSVSAWADEGNYGSLTSQTAQTAPEAQPVVTAAPINAENVPPPVILATDYTIGVDDVFDISILQPEKMELTITVSPDGAITFPYIGQVSVKDKTPAKVQEEIQSRLADGYLKYPVVSVSLKESHSRKFFVYGEVTKPGTYFLEENITVLKAIFNAGGFTKFGSSSRVKVLRPKADNTGYEMIKVNIKSIMSGQAQDVVLQIGDIVQVQEGVF